MKVGETASRVGEQVYHSGQGQDERAHPHSSPLLRGLDSLWSGVANPHRESGTRWRAAADVGQAEASEGKTHGRRSVRDGNRLGDSVGAQTPCTGEQPRSAQRPPANATGRRRFDSGGVLPGRMSQLSSFKGRALIGASSLPHAIDDAHPNVCQSSQCHTMGFAFRAFALIGVTGPGFLHRRLPGELVQMVAQGFQASKAFVRFGIIATLERDGSRSGQRLDAIGSGIAAAIFTPFGQQTRREALACPRQRTPDRLVIMGQKKGVDLLIVASNVLDEHQQLFDQREHQPRLGTHDDLAGNQLGAVQFLKDLGSHLHGVGMLADMQAGGDLFQRSGLRGGWGRVGLQEDQAGVLMQLGKQLQGRRIVLLEAGRQLVDQPRLRLDQGILIAGERFQLLDGDTIRLQATQLGQIEATDFGQQIGINLIGLGSGGFAQLIGGLGVDRIDGETGFQQKRDEQAVVRFDNASQLLGRSRDAEQKRFQFVQALMTVSKASHPYALTRFVQDKHIMMGICPIHTDVPHTRASLSLQLPGVSGPYITGARSNVPPIIDWPRKTAKGRTIFFYRSSRVEKAVFPRQYLLGRNSSCRPLSKRVWKNINIEGRKDPQI